MKAAAFLLSLKEKERFVIELSYNNCKLVSGGDSEFVQCMDQNWGNNTFVGGVSGAIAGAVGGAGVLSLPGAVAGGILGIVGGSTGTGAYCGMRSIFKSMMR
jgi:hypothetical protein